MASNDGDLAQTTPLPAQGVDGPLRQSHDRGPPSRARFSGASGYCNSAGDLKRRGQWRG
jgi:hypothetical protein